MIIREALGNIQHISSSENSPKVVDAVIQELRELAKSSDVQTKSRFVDDSFHIAVTNRVKPAELMAGNHLSKLDNFVYIEIHSSGSGCLISSHSRYLYSCWRNIKDNRLNEHIDAFSGGKLLKPAFGWQRISYDYFLTQEGRIQRGLNRESYVKEMARLGFTHVEINGLHCRLPVETGPKGEAYPMFYTYCPALDQFTSSTLNEGLYPHEYISSNLDFLKENARLAVKYGITPGLLCFEPRSVPEKFFTRYPMLRGARVDHPFRSFKPRYNMTIAHPVVREHYAEMLQNLLKEVPELGYITVWTNDSGAGCELNATSLPGYRVFINIWILSISIIRQNSNTC